MPIAPLTEDETHAWEAEPPPRQGVRRPDEARRDDGRAGREREPGRPAPPATIAAHGSLREHREQEARKEAQWEDGWELWTDEKLRPSSRMRKITTITLTGSYL